MIICRRFQTADAQGISALFRACYGDRYVYSDVYLPEMICYHNAHGRWCSLVAEQKGAIVGHAILWFTPDCGRSAELAMFVVHPSIRHRGIATLLGKQLCLCARKLHLNTLTIKMVSCHQHTQRLAKTLGFHSTALFRDYVSSPFKQGERESVVLGVLPLQPRPVPRCLLDYHGEHWLSLLAGKFGTAPLPVPADETAPPIEISVCDERVNIMLNKLSQQTIKEISHLPCDDLIYVRARIDESLLSLLPCLHKAGYVNMGLAPAAQGRWFWLLQRGYTRRKLNLCCPVANALQDSIAGSSQAATA